MTRSKSSILNARLKTPCWHVRCLLTTYGRGERFSDGFWPRLFDAGRLTPVMQRLAALKL
ncbi:MAG: DUF6508 domain-containing protein [Oceanobacter sp.]